MAATRLKNDGPVVAFSKPEIEQSIPARFEQQVLDHSTCPAIEMDGHRVTYSELNAMSNRISHRLLELGDHRKEPVAILMDQSIPLIATILGILKAGKIYVPIDPTEPAERISSILKESGVSVLLTDGFNKKAALNAACKSQQIINIESIGQDTHSNNPNLDLSPDDSAYIFYTSGSTGSPKGVVDSHRNVLHNIMRYTNNLQISCNDRLTLLQACNFSGSVSSLFCALLNGASVYPFDVRRSGIDKLARLLIEESITIYHSVPSLFEQVLRTGRYFRQLRVIRLEGDRCTTRHVELYQRHFRDDCILANGLGATETGLTHQYFIYPSTVINGSVVPVGHPTEDMEAIIVDDEDRAVPTGQEGEIAIKSAHLATGYWRNTTLTNKAFPIIPGTDKRLYRTGDMGRIDDDGMLEHLGRKDFQVKIRGHRVDIEALEKTLATLSGVSQAVVHGQTNWSGHQRLVAYVVLEDPYVSSTAPTVTGSAINQDFNETRLRQQLLKLFPAYMIPARFVRLAELPMDANGKISRKELQPPDNQRPSLNQRFVAPRSDTEKDIAAIWGEILNVQQVGLHDDFFELGGDSILAIVLPMLIEEKIGIKLSDASVLQARTVCQLAQRIDKTEAMRCVLAIQPKGLMRPFFCIHAHTGRVLEYRELADMLGENQPFYAVQPKGHDGNEPPLSSIEAMAAHYIKEIRTIQPSGPYSIGGYCLGGLIAYEIARQIRVDEQENNLIVMIDTECPRGGIMRRLSPRKHMHKISRLAPKEKIPYICTKLKRFAKRTSESLWTRVAALSDDRQGADLEQRFPWGSEPTDIQRAIDAAQKRYKPKSYDGDVTLICVEPADLYDYSTQAGWDTLIKGKLQIISLPRLGAKYDFRHLFQEPYLTQLGNALKNVLEVSSL